MVETSRHALAAAALGAVLLAACASTPKPDAELAISNAAVNSALSAGAADAAPDELRTARDKLDRARVQRDSGHNDIALALAREATVDARLAEQKALAARTRKSAEDLSQANRALADEVARKSNN
ncbi:DUF4398 domain-containing protein [Paucibacter sp. R3-3]|uniref:DUF4398 domain-containing protein n=1 Tax=Roseateles agri TaxID=3098619 RepID=A0ABU5DIR7_9BURK|nr:DUF4398 domain-containing protein [Paucibacter sp. R3-3]MDY0745124.1 DUF4398 domain-containing protein [Paucibacter sp. R3-3]